MVDECGATPKVFTSGESDGSSDAIVTKPEYLTRAKPAPVLEFINSRPAVKYVEAILGWRIRQGN
jgi:hypothetical protein